MPVAKTEARVTALDKKLRALGKSLDDKLSGLTSELQKVGNVLAEVSQLSADGRESLVRDLVTALRDIASDPCAWRLRGQQGRKRAEANYGWDARMSAGLKIYRGLMEGGAHV